MYKIEEPEGLGMPGPRRGALMKVSGVKPEAWIVIVKAGKDWYQQYSSREAAYSSFYFS